MIRLLLSCQTPVKGEMFHQGLQHLHSQSIAVLVSSLPFIVLYVAGGILNPSVSRHLSEGLRGLTSGGGGSWYSTGTDSQAEIWLARE